MKSNDFVTIATAMIVSASLTFGTTQLRDILSEHSKEPLTASQAQELFVETMKDKIHWGKINKKIEKAARSGVNIVEFRPDDFDCEDLWHLTYIYKQIQPELNARGFKVALLGIQSTNTPIKIVVSW